MCLHAPYRKIRLSAEAHFPWIGIAFASAAFRIFRVFRAPFRVFRVSQQRLLFRAIPRVPGYSAPFRAPSHSAPSLRFREARNNRLVTDNGSLHGNGKDDDDGQGKIIKVLLCLTKAVPIREHRTSAEIRIFRYGACKHI